MADYLYTLMPDGPTNHRIRLSAIRVLTMKARLGLLRCS